MFDLLWENLDAKVVKLWLGRCETLVECASYAEIPVGAEFRIVPSPEFNVIDVKGDPVILTADFPAVPGGTLLCSDVAVYVSLLSPVP